jgi:hypothetical protein
MSPAQASQSSAAGNAIPTAATRQRGAVADEKRSGWDWLRWGAALIVALAATAYFLNAVGEQNVCEHVLAGADSAPRTIEVCGPPGLLNLVPFAALVAMLLWPDLGELAVTGLVSLKRRVQEQEARQDAVESRLVHIDQHLSQLALLAQSQLQGQSQAAAATVNVYAPDQDDVRRGIVEKESAAERPEGHPPTDDGDAGDHARLLGTFLQEYSKLEPYVLRYGTVRSQRDLEALDPDQRDLVVEWNEIFHREITALRQTRNVAVHEPDTISVGTLRGAIDNTRELSRILFGRLGSAASS